MELQSESTQASEMLALLLPGPAPHKCKALFRRAMHCVGAAGGGALCCYLKWLCLPGAQVESLRPRLPV